MYGFSEDLRREEGEDRPLSLSLFLCLVCFGLVFVFVKNSSHNLATCLFESFALFKSYSLLCLCVQMAGDGVAATFEVEVESKHSSYSGINLNLPTLPMGWTAVTVMTSRSDNFTCVSDDALWFKTYTDGIPEIDPPFAVPVPVAGTYRVAVLLEGASGMVGVRLNPAHSGDISFWQILAIAGTVLGCIVICICLTCGFEIAGLTWLAFQTKSKYDPYAPPKPMAGMPGSQEPPPPSYSDAGSPVYPQEKV